MLLHRLIAAVSLTVCAAPAATYYRDIAPILLQSCAPCHRPGQSGPFALLTYDDARRRAVQIVDVTRRRYMPPWLPEPGHGDFAGERRLTETQIEAIAEWARTGTPAGAPSDAPHAPVFAQDWMLGPPDLVLRASKPLMLPADGPDVFWNFILSPSVQGIRYVKAVEIRPGSARAHHANMLVDRTRSTRRQETTAGAGFPGMDITIETDSFDPDSHFLFWKPGGAPRVEPDGMAWRLEPGADLVVNMHLQPSGKPESVQPTIGLYFTDRPASRLPMLVKLENDRALDIPAGVRDFAVSDDFQLPADVDVLAVYPHAHYLGSLLEAFATLPDGSRRWLIRIPQWDVNWQSVYSYREPVFLPKGTVISMRYHYDNSAANPRNPNVPPKRVVGGNQATDEMGHFWLQLLPRGEGDRRPILQEALLRHRLEKHPDDVVSHLNLGTLLLGRNDRSEAITHLQLVLRFEPANAQALNNLGAALQGEGRLEEAVEAFRGALRAQEDYPNARFNLANALIAKGELAAAAENLRSVLVSAPNDRAARSQLVATLARLGNYRELVDLEPENPDFRNNFGIILAKSGDFAGAIAQFQAALQANPSHAAARRNLEQIRSRR